MRCKELNVLCNRFRFALWDIGNNAFIIPTESPVWCDVFGVAECGSVARQACKLHLHDGSARCVA